MNEPRASDEFFVDWHGLLRDGAHLLLALLLRWSSAVMCVCRGVRCVGLLRGSSRPLQCVKRFLHDFSVRFLQRAYLFLHFFLFWDCWNHCTRLGRYAVPRKQYESIVDLFEAVLKAHAANACNRSYKFDRSTRHRFSPSESSVSHNLAFFNIDSILSKKQRSTTNSYTVETMITLYVHSRIRRREFGPAIDRSIDEMRGRKRRWGGRTEQHWWDKEW